MKFEDLKCPVPDCNKTRIFAGSGLVCPTGHGRVSYVSREEYDAAIRKEERRKQRAELPVATRLKTRELRTFWKLSTTPGLYRYGLKKDGGVKARHGDSVGYFVRAVDVEKELIAVLRNA